MDITVLCEVTSSGLLGSYQCFQDTWCFHLVAGGAVCKNMTQIAGGQGRAFEVFSWQATRMHDFTSGRTAI